MEDQMSKDVAEQLKILRRPFDANHISKLPKPTKKQTDEVKQDVSKGIRCNICGGWHHPKVVHLDYVGHAALTDRLLDTDIGWYWEPVALDGKGLPALDADGGLWIRLTVCGVTRLGYGSADGKTGGDAMKERIGDALRNAGMRFGAALDLWHKGILHMDDDDAPEPGKPVLTPKTAVKGPIDIEPWIAKMVAATTPKELGTIAMTAFEATNDERITVEHQRILAERKAAKQTKPEQVIAGAINA